MSGLYIHIPFCTQRCLYCDFHTGTQLHLKERYLACLKRELHQRCSELKEPLESVYIGGGTPSLLSVEELSDLFDAISCDYDLSGVKEISMECNADDLTSAYVKDLSCLPINRLSIGIQSFNDVELSFLHRRHTSQQANDAVRLSMEAGFTNISIDLMYALPEQTLEGWQYTLHEATSLEVQHISAYSLMYEPGTVLTSRLKRGLLTPLSDEQSVAQFDAMREWLTGCGYGQYEISNFAKPGYSSLHNSNYWRSVPYIGVGAGAHSFMDNIRRWNVANTRRYCEALISGEVYWEGELLSDQERFNEIVFTGLRTRRGVNLGDLKEAYGSIWVDELLKSASVHLKMGVLQYEKGWLSLTSRGIYVSDSIMSDLMRVDE